MGTLLCLIQACVYVPTRNHVSPTLYFITFPVDGDIVRCDCSLIVWRVFTTGMDLSTRVPYPISGALDDEDRSQVPILFLILYLTISLTSWRGLDLGLSL